MIDLLIGIVTLLSLRSLALLFLEKKPFFKRFLDALIALFFILLDLLLFLSAEFNFKIFFISALISLIIIIPFLWRRIKVGASYPPIKKFMGSLFILITTGTTLGVASLTDRPILIISLTGKTQKETVLWKNPDSAEQKQEVLETYELLISDTKGKPLQSLYVYGDLIAIRAQVVRINPMLHFLGIRNLHRFDLLYNSYYTLDQMNNLPLKGYPLTFSKGNLFGWKLWNKIYFNKPTNKYIFCATLESQHLPLRTKENQPIKADYSLTINSGGVSISRIEGI